MKIGLELPEAREEYIVKSVHHLFYSGENSKKNGVICNDVQHQSRLEHKGSPVKKAPGAAGRRYMTEKTDL